MRAVCLLLVLLCQCWPKSRRGHVNTPPERGDHPGPQMFTHAVPCNLSVFRHTQKNPLLPFSLFRYSHFSVCLLRSLMIHCHFHCNQLSELVLYPRTLLCLCGSHVGARQEKSRAAVSEVPALLSSVLKMGQQVSLKCLSPSTKLHEGVFRNTCNVGLFYTSCLLT
jgi:hypothetical protein